MANARVGREKVCEAELAETTGVTGRADAKIDVIEEAEQLVMRSAHVMIFDNRIFVGVEERFGGFTPIVFGDECVRSD